MRTESLKTATLDQRLLTTGSETSIRLKTTEGDEWGATAFGHVLIGPNGNEEHVYFSGTTVLSTINGVVTFTINNTVRGVPKNASSPSSSSAGAKKDNTVGTRVIFTLHSSFINNFFDNTVDNTVTGSISFDNTSTTPFVPPVYNTAEVSSVTKVEGAFWYNQSSGIWQGYTAGNVVDFDMSTPVSFATESAAGLVQFASTSEKNSKAATNAITGAPLVVQNNDTIRLNDPSNANTTDHFGVGENSTGSRDVSIGLYADAAYTGGSFLIEREADTSGDDENAATVMSHRGTGVFDIALLENGRLTLTGAYGYARTYTAGGTIGAGTAVYYDSADEKVKAGANGNVATARIIGVTVNNSTDGNPIIVQETGVVYLPGLSLTAGTKYYLSNSAGAFTSTLTKNSLSTIPVQLGVALSPTLLQLNIQRIQRVLNVTGYASVSAGGGGTSTIQAGVFTIDRVDFSFGGYPINFGNGFSGVGTYRTAAQYSQMSYSLAGISGNSYKGYGPTAGLICKAMDSDGDMTSGVMSVSSGDLIITWAVNASLGATQIIYFADIYELI